MTPDEYEELVATIVKIVAEKGDGLPPDALKYGRSNRWQGVSGHPHQIDVSVETKDKIVLVECKRWKDSVTVETVLVMQGRLDDIRPRHQTDVEATIITKTGFQSGARKLGRHFGIQCNVVKSEEEWAFKFANQLVIRPSAAIAKASAGIGSVQIIDHNEDEDAENELEDK